MIESVLFIGLVIAAVTQAIKYLVPQVNGAVTIVVAALVGVLVAVFDVQLGIEDITIAQGVLTGLAAAGVTTVASKVGGGTTTPVEGQ